MSSTILTIRKAILTAGAVGIIATGAVLGGEIREVQHATERQEEMRQATPDEIIATLEARISDLQSTRSGILRKVEAVEKEMEMKAREKSTG